MTWPGVVEHDRGQGVLRMPRGVDNAKHIRIAAFVQRNICWPVNCACSPNGQRLAVWRIIAGEPLDFAVAKAHARQGGDGRRNRRWFFGWRRLRRRPGRRRCEALGSGGGGRPGCRGARSLQRWPQALRACSRGLAQEARARWDPENQLRHVAPLRATQGHRL